MHSKPGAWAQGALAASLELGCVPHPHRVAHALLVTRKPGENLWNGDKHGAAHPAQLSRWMGKMDWPQFVHQANQRLVGELFRRLARHPPRGTPLALADEHENRYWPQMPCRAKVKGERWRNHYKSAKTARNKASPACDKWFVVVVAWRSGGRVHRFPAMVVPMHAPYGPRLDWVKQAWRHLNNASRTKFDWILDRGYDDDEVRDFFVSRRVRWIIRHRIGQNQGMLVEGRRTTIRELIAERMQGIVKPSDCESCRRYGVLCMRFTVRAHITGSQVPCNLEIHAALEREVGPYGQPMWVWNRKGSSAIAYEGFGDIDDAVLRYGLRWNVETVFRMIEELGVDDRPKTIMSHVAVTLATFMHVASAGDIEDWDALCWPGTSRPIPKRLRTPKTASTLLDYVLEGEPD